MATNVKKIKRVDPQYLFEEYTHIVSPISAEDGAGFLVTFPDLPGCMSDGETEQEAIANARDAFSSWMSARIDAGENAPTPEYRTVPMPDMSGKFVARVPKTIHAKLAIRAKEEGVSLNTLVLALIAEGLGRRDAHA
jgi:predicted RNase H-like HicB family nuclease